MQASDLTNEWRLLQNQTDSYEKFSLLLKLFNASIVFVSYINQSMGFFILMLVLILWLQDAIWKTFQSRIEDRLLQLENDIADNVSDTGSAYQFNRLYLQSRHGLAGLIREYMSQAVRPTVAFPHVLFFLMIVADLYSSY